MIFRYAVLITVTLNAALNTAVAFENVPDVSKGAQQFHEIYKSGGLPQLVIRIQECWATFETKKTQGAAARCFALDYTANLIDDVVAKRSGLPSSEFLRIEKVLTRVNRALIALKIEQKERGTLISDWTIVSENEATRLAKNSTPTPVAKIDASGKEMFGRARLAILQKLNNPKSAKFMSLERVTVPNQNGVATDVICGKVDITNQRGNYVGFRFFVYFVGDGTSYYDNGIEDPGGIGAEVVKNFCTD